ncbi:tyrosine-protein phosphatase [Gordonia humi]|uniref:Protein-tyrosine phosphatase n=1 Tax=Gordonia humi TaxID=686429 RepID=A0A840F1X6_9ACTN|nr:tyrosine-protein phosphatase [Gordonia humi]MBB4137881.1 protein-tyrosine phosphatase [Gordonia humi]
MPDSQTAPVREASGPIASLPNLRELGGLTTDDGATVRSGLLYRTADFRGLTDDDAALFAGLGIKTLYDLRSDAERASVPDPSFDGTRHLALDVLADSEQAVPANMNEFFADPESVAKMNERLAGGTVVDAVTASYRHLVNLPSARAAYRRFFAGLAGEDEAPAAFHCTAGKDRTGWAAASLLTVLGVSRDEVYTDYLLTNERLVPSLVPLFGRFAEAGGDPDLLLPVFGVREEYLNAAFDEVAAQFGTIDGYLTGGLGLDAGVADRLRQTYLS